MAFNILSREFTADEKKTKGGKLGSICDILCDDYEDLPTAAEIEEHAILAGSWAWIANPKTYAVLNNAGEWVAGKENPDDSEETEPAEETPQTEPDPNQR